jgi:hypothetical protein
MIFYYDSYVQMCYNGWCMIRKGLRTFNLSICIEFDAGEKLRKTLKPLWIIHIVVCCPIFLNVLRFGT